ncbi:hypothetical protein AUEXF2481DRAFT_30563 [Aureobasidium subglaciale EXF-2481]|uniref:Zn(2)-C6 fungal-type domain-containing protein n=1 Tax=Aureobasidium subglaciale (strain EXF-2481) TaxID=1043005 RepID=A0A074YD85_AURSE|nr:uncharacterized protein AUEXF2481DRAFT_30563 [Aureobasidium subglaciale EXF-2481]KAI5196405.1 hypothetical protein E4T38_08511 [Aureobasidium subglaciale]KAI5215197.1 hypothetical protein E4T40_08555 [Aureobasidium subglaciale]KAI5218458.1 hypothetical protein E4T41_08408 [Aureobasidium subglaciale]KAI5256063.1 hypothetical protein E4T46_08443 [Aureobasidium subglaciale]KEQ94009.1 hypothetical protein AUEXF2481DRAFT_30563 [Aureobasidium subglaciale EXF-2481]
MPSIQDRPTAFTPSRQLQSWTHDDKNSPYSLPDHRRPSMVQPEVLRPMEPASMGTAPRPLLGSRITDPSQPRQQLPGLQELLSPALRTGPPSYSPHWPSVNNAQPANWSHGSGSVASAQLPPANGHSQMGSLPFNPTPPPFHRLSLDVSPADRFAQTTSSGPISARPSLPGPLPSQQPPPMLRKLSDYQGPHVLDQVSQSAHIVDNAGPPQPHVASPYHGVTEGDIARRLNATQGMRDAPPASNYSLQCVGQRHIPGEGMCYVFKDGSTCPTIIDGEPVNPLWGTTKAGKARKRLAQACLNCREKKIKCEPGEKSCLQCEKAKRECHRFASPRSVADCLLRNESRPSAPQQPVELANHTTLTIPNVPLGRADWSSQSSGSIVMADVPNQKRRRSAQAAQQDVLNGPPAWSRERSPQSVKRRKSDVSASSQDGPFQQDRQRKDSKRVDLEDIITQTPRPEKLDPSSWNEDPYLNDPEATMRFLELFFAQSAREVSIMFPRDAFTRWVRQCRDKCQRECMVLYSVLALGSIFAENEFSSFAKLCAERAGQAVSRIDGKFSLAVVQARLLVAGYNHLVGQDSAGWDLSGSALRVLSAMRLNSEEGCGEDLDEYKRRYFNFSREQVKECRRRTFWTAFLVDRYHGFCGGLLCAIQLEDIQVRLPCNDQIYEDGFASDAPLFDCFQPGMGIQSLDPKLSVPSPAAYTVVIASLWTDVTKLIFRRPRQGAGSGSYVKSHESLLGDIQAKLFDWRTTLPVHLRYSRQNLVEAIQHGFAGSLIAMHALYHISQLKAARNAHHELLSPHTTAQQIRFAHSHAIQLLEMVVDVRSTKPHGSGKGQDPINLLSPFFAYGITAAIDTLSAGGLKEDFGRTMMLINDSTATLHDLAQFCASAKVQAKQASRRMALIEIRAAESFGTAAVVAAPRVTNGRDNNDCWRINEPMEKVFTLQQDVCYGTSPAIYFTAIRGGR